MNHLSDKDLDRLSKEAAEQLDVQQNTSGWDQLHRKLNKELPVQGTERRRRFLLLLIFFAFLTGGGMIYSYLNSPSPNSTELQAKKPDTKNKSLEKATHDVVTERKTLSGSSKKTNKPENNKETESPVTANVVQADRSAAPVSDFKKESESKKYEPLTSGTDSERATDIKKNKTIQEIAGVQKNKSPNTPDVSSNKKIVTTKLTPISNQSLSGKKSGMPVTQKQDYNDEKKENIIVQKEEPAAPQKKADVSDVKPAMSDVQVNAPVTSAKKAKTPVRIKYPFTVGLVTGPDLSNVNFRFNDKPGYNAGIRLSWQFAPRFAVSTGAVYTKKNYSAIGNDYHPPKGYWTNYVTIDKVIGSCWMIDVPLEIRYDLHAGNSSKWFVSSGLSTYLMNKEDYEYHYMNNGQYTVRRWINDEHSSYILSVANLSAGYEQMVGKHISVQAEPYLKVPLSGVGFGKMQMNSYGLNISIRYGFSFTKKLLSTTSP